MRSIQIEDDEMEMSDEDRDYQTVSHAKRKRYDSDNLKVIILKSKQNSVILIFKKFIGRK